MNRPPGGDEDAHIEMGAGSTRRPAQAGWLPARRAAPTFARQSSGLRVGGLAGERCLGGLKPARMNIAKSGNEQCTLAAVVHLSIWGG